MHYHIANKITVPKVKVYKVSISMQHIFIPVVGSSAQMLSNGRWA